MVRRLLIAIVFGLLLLFPVVPAVRAQNASTPASTSQGVSTSSEDYAIHQEEVNAYYKSIEDCSSPSLECLVRNVTRFVAMEWVNDISGPAGAPAKMGADASGSTPVAARSAGAIGGLYTMIGGMYAYPPANTSRYVADVLDNAGIVPPAYAQGLGFASLDPILSLWKSFRNVAYFFFIAVLIVIGIMVMLRQKISAQASVTAQQALPGIIISLILVTFSYAISGLLIDAMYLSMYLIAGLFDTISSNALGSDMISLNIFQLGGMLFNQGAIKGFNNNANVITSIISGLTTSSGESNWLTGFLGLLGGLTISIVVAVAVLIATVKLFFELLKSYASIIMGVVFSPIYLMLGAIPGTNAVGPWIKNMVGNLAAFPAVLLFVLIFKIFTENIENDNTGGFMPPYLVGHGQAGIAGYIIGFAILLALPEIVKEVKKKLGAQEGGFGWMVFGAARGGLAAGWKGGRSTLGVGARDIMGVPALPFSLMGLGPQTKLESALLGSRAYRKREQELAIQSGGTYKGREYGGLVGAAQDRFGVQRESLDRFRRLLSSRRSTSASAGTTTTGTSSTGAASVTPLTPGQKNSI